MTIKEKWKDALTDYILTGNILVKVRENLSFPYTKLLSVKTKDVIREKMLCPYCFDESEFKFNETKQYAQSTIQCKHCGHEYEKIRYATKSGGVLYASGTWQSGTSLIYFDVATIMDYTGIFFILVEDATYKLDLKKKRISTNLNVESFGFICPEKRFYFRNGTYTACSVNSFVSYRANTFFTDEALQMITAWGREQVQADARNALYRLKSIEERFRQNGTSGVLSRKRGQQIIDSNPVADLSKIPQKAYTGTRIRIAWQDNLSGVGLYEGYCYQCGKTFQYKAATFRNIVEPCPHCGTKDLTFFDGQKHCEHQMVIDNCDNGDLVLRLLVCKLTPGKKNIEVDRTEVKRIYVRKNTETPKWDVLSSEDGERFRYKKTAGAVEANFKLEDIIIMPKAKDDLKYSGFSEYADVLSSKGGLTETKLVKYLAVYNVYPFIEKIVKVGWTGLAESAIEEALMPRSPDFNEKGNTLNEVLKLPKPLVKFLSEWTGDRPQKNNLNELRLFYEMDPNVTVEDLRWCSEYRVYSSMLREIIETLGISVHQACEYLERVRVSQCFVPSGAVTEWRDYLKACQTIDVDLTDKTVRYPSSLKREHDRAVFKQKIIMDEKKERMFGEICRDYGDKYTFSDEKYQIIVPHSMQDLFEEGRKLNHCVGQYADRVVDGCSCICFIRKKEKPDLPYFTVEIFPSQDRITQIHGLSNRDVDEKRDVGLKDFLKKWAKTKQLKLSYF